MTLEERIRILEDRFEIYNLIASHPISADTAAKAHIRSMYDEDGIMDLGGTKSAAGNENISNMSQRQAHQDAIAAGIAHLVGLPYVEISGDTAVVTSYLQVITPHPTADPVDVPAHGTSPGYRIHRVGANRWELLRTQTGWKIKRRSYRSLDGTQPALDILNQALA